MRARRAKRRPAPRERPGIASSADLEEIEAFLVEGTDVAGVEEEDWDHLAPARDGAAGHLSLAREDVTPVDPAALTDADPVDTQTEVLAPEYEVVVSADAMAATLRARLPEGTQATREDLQRWVTEKGVTSGLRAEVLDRMVEALNGQPGRWVAGTIARGTPADSGIAPEWTLATGVPDPKASRLLEALWSSGRLAEAGAGLAGLPLVAPGQVVGRRNAGRPAQHGMTVKSTAIEPEPVEGASLEWGAGVVCEAGEARAAHCGYLCLVEDVATVVAAVGMTEDEMTAWVLVLQVPCEIPADRVVQALAGLGMAEPPPTSSLSQRLQQIAVPGQVTIAEGVASRAGEDGRVEHDIDASRKVGRIGADGSIDFKQLNLATLVQEGQRLACVHPPTAGTPGLTLTGRQLPSPEGAAAVLVAGEGVVEQDAGGKRELVSGIEGSARLEGEILSVRPLLEVEEVAFETGDIDFRGDVVVKGVVKGGFSVKATGDVFAQTLENGAVVDAGRDVTVKYGILGLKTRVCAGRKLMAQFVQDGSITARSAEIGSYLYGARLRARYVKVHGKGDRGGVVGGTLCVRDLADLSTTGCEYGTPTKVLAGVDPVISGRVRRAEEGLKTCRRYCERLRSSLGLKPRQSLRATGRTPKERKLAYKLRELEQMQEKLEGELVTLRGESRQVARKGRVIVRGMLHPGTALVIGHKTLQPAAAVGGIEVLLNQQESLQARPVRDSQEALT